MSWVTELLLGMPIDVKTIKKEYKSSERIFKASCKKSITKLI